MELEELKNTWQELSKKIENAELYNKQLTMKMLHRNTYSTVEKMEKFESFFLIISVIFAGLMGVALIVNYNSVFKSETIVTFLSLFILSAFWQIYAITMLNGIKYSSSPTMELIEKVVKYKIRTKWRIIVGMILLIPFFAIVIYFQKEMLNTSISVSAIIGGTIGLVIGIKADIEHFRNINKLLKDLEEIKELKLPASA